MMRTHSDGGPEEWPSILLSIQMQSNRPENFVRFLDEIEKTAYQPSSIEVIVKIDDDDRQMNELLTAEVVRRRLHLKYISTPLPEGFYGLWRSMDEMFRLTAPSAYFVLNLNDETSFTTPHWDLVLRRYVGLFPDHIFRLRTSDRRHRNYYDYWEAGFANDTSAIITRRWLEINGGWCPCNGPDSFQESVAFYLGYNRRFDQSGTYRDIAISDITFKFAGPNVGLKGEALRQRFRGSLRPWFRLMSHQMQQEASRRAEKLRAHIWAHENGIASFTLLDDRRRGRLRLKETDAALPQQAFEYKLSRIRIATTNLWRVFNFGYYGGGGEPVRKPWIRNFLGFFLIRYERLDRIASRLRVGRIRTHRFFAAYRR